MKTFIGIDLGSTTTKAIVLDDDAAVLGRGITNSRSNYGIAAEVAKQDAFLDTRFFLFRKRLQDLPELDGDLDEFLDNFEQDFRLEQYLEQLNELEKVCTESARDARLGKDAAETRALLAEIFRRLNDAAPDLYAQGSSRKSDFFRDIAGSRYLAIRRGQWKYLAHKGSGGNRYESHRMLKEYMLPDTAPNAPGQLYDLEADPGETKNLYFDRPEIVEELESLLAESIRSGRSVPPGK